MLTDNFNRVIHYVRISVTDRCNLRCRYCIDGDFTFISHDEILRHEEIIRFTKICADLGVNKVRLTGGEPLIRKGIPFLLKELSAIEGIKDISLTTNGVYLGEMILELKNAGLKRINISLDSLKKERFQFITGVNALDSVLMSIEKALYAGLNPIKINTVIIKGFNDDEILDFAKIANNLNIDVRFIELMPFGDAGLWDNSHVVLSHSIEEVIRRQFHLEPLSPSGEGPAKMFKIKDGLGKIGFISPVSSHICAECNRIRLTSYGTIRPCLFSDIEYDIKTMLRDGSSDDEVKTRIMNIIKAKPERKKEIGYIKKCQRSMRHIGG